MCGGPVAHIYLVSHPSSPHITHRPGLGILKSRLSLSVFIWRYLASTHSLICTSCCVLSLCSWPCKAVFFFLSFFFIPPSLPCECPVSPWRFQLPVLNYWVMDSYSLTYVDSFGPACLSSPHAKARWTLKCAGVCVCVCRVCVFSKGDESDSHTHFTFNMVWRGGTLVKKKCVGSHLRAHVVLEKVRFTLTTLSNTFLALTSEREL